MALGDIDSDGYADIVTIDDTENQFVVHYYNPKGRNYDLWSYPAEVD